MSSIPPDPDSSGASILHVDMDAFFASVEQRDHPEWKGLPVIVGSAPDQRGVVCAASYEARKYGVHSAMPSRTAGLRCPHGIFVPPRSQVYQDVSRQVFAIFEAFTPRIQGLSIDEAFLDVSGSHYLFGSGVEIAGAIRRRIQSELHLTASVGVAPNKFLAKLASDMNKPDGLTVTPTEPEAIRTWLEPLPVNRMWGVGPRTSGILNQAGYPTFGDIQASTPETLSRLVGKALADHIHQLAFGRDDREVAEREEEKSISSEHTFSTDCQDPDPLHACLVEQVETVGRRLRKAGRKAQTVQLKLRDSAFHTITRQESLPNPTSSDTLLLKLALDLFERHWNGKAVRLIGFGVTRFHDPANRVAEQLELFTTRSTQRSGTDPDPDLDQAVDALRTRFGKGAIRRGSHLS